MFDLSKRILDRADASVNEVGVFVRVNDRVRASLTKTSTGCWLSEVAENFGSSTVFFNGDNKGAGANGVRDGSIAEA